MKSEKRHHNVSMDEYHMCGTGTKDTRVCRGELVVMEILAVLVIR